MSLRSFNQIFIERDTSQKHLKRDVFFVTSLRPLKYILKIPLFCQKYLLKVFVTIQKYFTKAVLYLCVSFWIICLLERKHLFL